MNKNQIKIIINILLAISVGLTTGLIAIFFNSVIDIGVELTKGFLVTEHYFYFVMPLIGALITSVLYRFYLKDDHTGLGIVHIHAELENINTFLMKPFRVIIRVIGAGVTLIFGFSAGRFGPIVHLGAAVGSNVGYFLKMNPDRIRMLIGCGAASAISAVFGMPLFGAVFVLEVLYKKKFEELFAPIVVASVSASLLNRFLSVRSVINAPLLDASKVDYNQIVLFSLFGIVIGIMAVAYIWTIEKTSKFFKRIDRVVLRLIIAAVLIAVIGYCFPLNFEIHAMTTTRILQDEFSLKLLIMIALIKIISTGITLGSGFIGGNFYPAVTIGAATGVAYGKLSEFFLSQSHQNQIFGYLGIGGMISAYLNAPISGIILVLEFSRQYQLVVPALIVCSISVLTAYYFYGKDIFSTAYEAVLDDLKESKID